MKSFMPGPASSRIISSLVVALVVVSLSACAEDDTVPAGQPLEAEWISLFDGNTLDHWRGIGSDSIPAGHWRVEDGTIRKVASGNVPVAPDGQPLEGGDIMTRETFRDFEFAFEWKVAPGANSGVKYNVSEEMSIAAEPVTAALGFEYQVLDDSLHADAELPSHRTAALYDMIPPNENKRTNPVGEWNQARIVFVGNHGEHWLNGEKVVEYDLDSPRFDSLLAASKYAKFEGFADKRDGHIVLQDHKDDVWYRNVRVRRLAQ